MTQGYDDNFRADRHADEDLVPFDVRDYSGRRAMWLLVLCLAILLVAAITFLKLYHKGTRDRSAPPEIPGEVAPYKVEPENPGGEVTPNQNKSVYDVMNGTAETEDVVKAPRPETPVDLPRQATIIVQQPDAGRPSDVKPSTPAAAPQSAAPQPTEPKSAGSAYVVQVASVRARADVERLLKDINTKFAGILPAGSYGDIKRVDLNEKGIYYRLQFTGLADKAAADRLCNQFVARKQACFVTRR